MKQEEESKKRAKRGLANVVDYQRTFTSDHGKKVLWDLIKHNGVLMSSLQPGDAYVTAYNDGRRCAILDIVNKLKMKPKELLEQLEEQESGDA